jgi:hypothetical protein
MYIVYSESSWTELVEGCVREVETAHTNFPHSLFFIYRQSTSYA